MLAKLHEQLRFRLQNGAKIVALEMTANAQNNPWVEYAGILEDDPDFAEWQQAIAENHQRIDEDPSIP